MPWKTIRTVSLWIVIAVMAGASGGVFEATNAIKSGFIGTACAESAPDTDEKEIEWFRDQMRISEKYVEDQEGVWGVAWGHFFTMVFLVLFALGALAVFIQRQRRTREILETIRKEIQDGGSG
ncbi:MAG: hypothetical protein K9J79_07395 [Desulfobacteraceae bacterium]|nr:hypothetical protein [Desulfobacteraceae bacterium]MCF8095175.1 hypothetical protein [Desulfobacteraceae bacterium]